MSYNDSRYQRSSSGATYWPNPVRMFPSPTRVEAELVPTPSVEHCGCCGLVNRKKCDDGYEKTRVMMIPHAAATPEELQACTRPSRDGPNLFHAGNASWPGRGSLASRK